MIVLDSNFLLMLLSPGTLRPRDPQTGLPVERVQDRIAFLVATIGKRRTKVLIPTPVYSEVLVGAGPARNAYLAHIEASAMFRVVAFDTKAAIEVADMTRAAIATGDKRDGAPDTWAKVKYDRQIVAIAKVQGASRIYSDDLGIRRAAGRLGIEVVGISECPLPPDEPQHELPLAQEHDAEATSASVQAEPAIASSSASSSEGEEGDEAGGAEGEAEAKIYDEPAPRVSDIGSAADLVAPTSGSSPPPS